MNELDDDDKLLLHSDEKKLCLNFGAFSIIVFAFFVLALKYFEKRFKNGSFPLSFLFIFVLLLFTHLVVTNTAQGANLCIQTLFRHIKITIKIMSN